MLMLSTSFCLYFNIAPAVALYPYHRKINKNYGKFPFPSPGSPCFLPCSTRGFPSPDEKCSTWNILNEQQKIKKRAMQKEKNGV
jgi:hypothetical protein